jgi:hypothetical protein
MRNAAPKAQDADAKPYEPTPADSKALEAYMAARAKGGPRLKVAANSIKIDHPDPPSVPSPSCERSGPLIWTFSRD